MNKLLSDFNHRRFWDVIAISALFLATVYAHKKHNSQTNRTKTLSKFGKVVQIVEGERDRNGLRSDGTRQLFCHQIQNA